MNRTNRELTSYLDLEVASRADICLAPQHVSSVCQRSIRNKHQLFSGVLAETNTIVTFVDVVDPGTRILFLFARCRYLAIFRYFATY